jgi:Ca2+/H+ antiporter, TMEM165/GDT1 family
MDWKLVLTTFGAVFLAEVGDKTQLATLAFATGASSRWAVFLGAAAALVATSAVPPALLRRISGAAFVAIGLWVLWSSRAGG